MKISYQRDTTEHNHNACCKVRAHHLDEKKIDCATAEINGRYPSKGRVTNQQCTEVIYVHAGSGKVVIEGKDIALNSGDALLIEPGEKYFFEGQLKFFISCTPAWYPEQHVLVEDHEKLVQGM